MKLKILLFIILTGAILQAQNEGITERIQSIIDNVKNEYAPDSRTAVFNTEIQESEGKYTVAGETNLPEAKALLSAKLKELNMDIEDNIIMLPAEDLEGKVFGVVNISVANIRTKPQHSAEMATQALLGTPLNVLKKQGGWYQVQTPDEYIGWVDDDGFAPMNREELDNWNRAEKVIYTNRYGISYSDKSENSTPVSDVTVGNIFIEGESAGGFKEIIYPDGRRAYVKNGEVKNYNEWLKQLQPDESNLVSTAKSMMGLPYLWGGTSAKGVDCSGFTKTVYFMNGILLPRDASQQVHTGELVNTGEGFDNLKPGDLLFFGRKAEGDKKERITHVGMYIGDTEFIHSAGMVKINSLDSTRSNFSEYRFKTFIRAKRILSSLEQNGVKLISNSLFK